MKLIVICILIALSVGCKSLISKDASSKFINEKETVSMMVYPVRVIHGNKIDKDPALSNQMIGQLSGFDKIKFIPTNDTLSIPFQWRHNQAKILRQSAAGFSSGIVNSNIDTDYALLVEILGNSEETWVGGIHYYICNKKGEIVKLALNNSHWETFQQVNPKNRHDGMLVAVNMLREFLKIREAK